MGNPSLKNSHTSNSALGFQPNQTYPQVIPNAQNAQQIPPGYVLPVLPHLKKKKCNRG